MPVAPYQNDDKTVDCSCEVYQNSAALLTNFALAQKRIKQVMEIADVISCDIYGDVTQEVKDLLEPYGTAFYNYNKGYQR